MSSLDSSGAVDGGRIRRAAARVVRERSIEYRELVSVLQSRYDVSELKIHNELNKCFDAALLYRQGDGDDAEVTLP